jgi:phosphohistidine phosphatase
MKTLLLLRHAKSSWDDPSLRDYERPLADRGRRDAPRMGEALKARGPLPDFIICSPATRARETLAAFQDAAQIEVRPSFDETIYGATSAELISVVRKFPDSSECALMVGHNPGFEELVARLSLAEGHMPTAALACITFDVDRWEDLEDGEGRLAWLLTPKTLSQA